MKYLVLFLYRITNESYYVLISMRYKLYTTHCTKFASVRNRSPSPARYATPLYSSKNAMEYYNLLAKVGPKSADLHKHLHVSKLRSRRATLVLHIATLKHLGRFEA